MSSSWCGRCASLVGHIGGRAVHRTLARFKVEFYNVDHRYQHTVGTVVRSAWPRRWVARSMFIATDYLPRALGRLGERLQAKWNAREGPSPSGDGPLLR
jgi:hypothetical protein